VFGGLDVAGMYRMMLTEDDTIIFVQGTSGPVRWGDRQLARAMRAAECPARLVVHQWHRSRPPCYVTWNRKEYALVERAAADLARMIADIQGERPKGTVHIAAQSAGCEVVRLGLAQLPPGASVESGIMVAPSVSPEAPLEDALAHVTRKLYYTTSSLDGLLAIGTWIVCSTDQKRCSSAGFTGFRPREGLDEESLRLYRERLVRVRWKPRHILDGWFGHHASGWSPRFAAKYAIAMFCDEYPPPGGQYPPPEE